MNNNILIAVAHDLTCDKGDEWLFHYLANNKEDLKKKSGDAIEDVTTVIIALCIIMVVIAIGIGIYFLFQHI